MNNSEFPILSWKRIIIDGITTPYIISDKGIIMNDATGEFMLVSPDKDNYPIVKLKVNGKDHTYKVHRLCCDAFNDNPFKLPEVDHINRNHWDASKDNLEFVSGLENITRLKNLREVEKQHLSNYDKVAKNRTKLTELQILQVCIRLSKGEPISEISRKTDVDVPTICMILDRKIWKNIACYFSFDVDAEGIFSKDEIDTILYYIDKGFTNKAILKSLDIQYPEYFEDFIDKLRNI